MTEVEFLVLVRFVVGIAPQLEQVKIITETVWLQHPAVVIVKRTYRTDAKTWKSVVTFALKKANSQWWITAFQNTPVQ